MAPAITNGSVVVVVGSVLGGRVVVAGKVVVGATVVTALVGATVGALSLPLLHPAVIRLATPSRRQALERADTATACPLDGANSSNAPWDAVGVQVNVRDADPSDLPALVEIAAAGGSPDADRRHLDFLRGAGQVLVAESPQGAVGFVGVLEVHEALMVTDLFVAAAHRGGGVGGRLLRHCLAGRSPAFTFSSTHPAALRAYASVGMQVQWPLFTMRGAVEGGSALVERAWCGGSVDVTRHLLADGAVSTGCAVLVRRDDATQVHRIEARPAEAVATLRELSAGLPVGSALELSVPAASPLLEWLVLHDFRIVDVDIHCATPGFVLDHRLAAVHRGLG